MSRLLLLFFGIFACAHPTPASSRAAAAAVVRAAITVSDLSRSIGFFSALGFETVGPSPGRLRLGREEIELVESTLEGRRIPEDSRSNDLWFEHIAIVVSDLERAVEIVEAQGGRPISNGPQTIPLSNPGAGGIRAYYFRDPDNHSLELIWYPKGKGRPMWQDTSKLFLGIDHTAIAVASTEESLRFYRDLLGLAVAGESLNSGVEQERLSGVPGAKVRITGLSGREGFGVEFLEYLEPGPGRPIPLDSSPNDLWHWEIVIAVDDLRSMHLDGAKVVSASDRHLLVRDPSGHAVRLVDRKDEK